MQDTVHTGTHVALLVKLNMRGARIAPGHRRVAPEDFGIVLEDPRVAPGVPESLLMTSRSLVRTSGPFLK